MSALALLSPLPVIRPGKGVNTLTPGEFKVGIVSVRKGRTDLKRGALGELRYTDPDTGYGVKRRVSGLERDEMRGMAANLTRRAYQGKSYLKERATWLGSRRLRR